MSSAQSIVQSFHYEQLTRDAQEQLINKNAALQERIMGLPNDRLLALTDGHYVAKVHSGLLSSRSRSLDPATEQVIQDTARQAVLDRIFDAATKSDDVTATTLVKNYASNNPDKVVAFALAFNERCTQAVLESDPAAPTAVALFNQVGATARLTDAQADQKIAETLRVLEQQRIDKIREEHAAKQQNSFGAQTVAGFVVATAIASGGVAVASPAAAETRTNVSVSQESQKPTNDTLGDVFVPVPVLPTETPDTQPSVSEDKAVVPSEVPDQPVTNQKLPDVSLSSGSVQVDAVQPQALPKQIAPNQIVDTPPPITEAPQIPSTGSADPANPEQPASPPVVEAPVSPDVFRDQLNSDTKDLMARIQAANKSKSIALMRGDTAIGLDQIGQGEDRMPDALVAANEVLLQDLQKVLDTDVHYIADGDTAWKQQILDNDTKAFYEKQQDVIHQIEATALAYEALGQNDQANQIRAEGAYYVTLDKLATDDNIRQKFLTPTPGIEQQPKPATPEKPAAPNQTPGHQQELQLNISDKLVLQHITKKQIANLEDKLSILLAVQDQTGVPWEVMASLWYREHAFSPTNPSNGQGIFQLYSTGLYFKPGKTTDKEFMRQAILAANFIKNKAKHVQEVPGEMGLTMSDDFVKEIFCQYNGCPVLFRNQAEARGFQNHAEGSPYVMNYADASRTPGADNWSQYRSDGGNIGNAGTQLGAFLLYRGLESAKITNVEPKPNKPVTPEKPRHSRDALFHDNNSIIIPNSNDAIREGNKLVAQTKRAMETGDIKGFIPLCPRKDPGHRCENRCDHIAALIWGHEHSGYETARLHRIAMHDQGKLHNGKDRYDVPIGAYMFWGKKGAGHAAIYAGNGMIYSTSIYDNAYDFKGGIYLAKASDITKIWGLVYTGWAYDEHLS